MPSQQWRQAASLEEPPPRRPVGAAPARPSSSRWHTAYALLFVLIAGVLVAGVYYALRLPSEDESVLLRQTGLRTRVLTPTPTPTAGPLAANENAAVDDAAADTTVSTQAAGPTALPLGTRYHVVENGDTLFGLAQRYGSSVEAIVAANNLASRNEPLRVGARLAIPPR